MEGLPIWALIYYWMRCVVIDTVLLTLSLLCVGRRRGGPAGPSSIWALIYYCPHLLWMRCVVIDTVSTVCRTETWRACLSGPSSTTALIYYWMRCVVIDTVSTVCRTETWRACLSGPSSTTEWGVLLLTLSLLCVGRRRGGPAYLGPHLLLYEVCCYWHCLYCV